MKLLTKALRKRFEQIGRQEESPDPIIVCKFFDPCSQWTWYATEFDGNDTFFGYVVGSAKELGYFSLTELSEFRGRLGLGIERDLHFDECKLSEIPDYHK
ncbi:MAG TPA: DUF2958 domain-containing protein [Anaerolineae bacterium]|nr:DUF2958 domain-containing protein [Anaerolineae bacterium]